MRKVITGIFDIALGAVLAIGTRTFLHVCGAGMKMEGAMNMGDGGMDMSSPPCHGIPTASLITGIILAIIGLVVIIAGSKKGAAIASGISNVILGIVSIGIPTFIVGVCESAHMHCHMVTRPALIIIGAAAIIIGAVNTAIELSNVASVDGKELKKWLPEKEKIIAS